MLTPVVHTIGPPRRPPPNETTQADTVTRGNHSRHRNCSSATAACSCRSACRPDRTFRRQCWGVWMCVGVGGDVTTGTVRPPVRFRVFVGGGKGVLGGGVGVVWRFEYRENVKSVRGFIESVRFGFGGGVCFVGVGLWRVVGSGGEEKQKKTNEKGITLCQSSHYSREELARLWDKVQALSQI